MVDNRRRVQFDDRAVETPDEDIDGPRPAPYRYERSRTARADFLSDRPIPLSLLGHSDGPDWHDLEDPLRKDRGEAIGSRRILKTAVLTASAIAIVFALSFLETTRAVVVNAKASFSGMQPRQSGSAPGASAPQPSRDARLASAGQPSALNVETTGSRGTSPTPAATPTREEIASAFQTALQSQTVVPQPPPATSPARRLDADEIAALLKRARSFIAIGDIVAARLLLERAADAQEAGAALLLAQTYDPAVLGTPDVRSITPDPAMARGWYQKAAQLGSREARQRLDQMEN
jgi:hypothetical protein